MNTSVSDELNSLASSARQKIGIEENFESIETRSIAELISEVANKYGDLPAFRCVGHAMSYSDLDRLSSSFAAYLQKNSGLRPGDRLAIMLPNVLQYPIALYGAFKAGMVVVNVNPMYTVRELRYQLSDANVKALIYFDQMESVVSKVLEDIVIDFTVSTGMEDIDLLGLDREISCQDVNADEHSSFLNLTRRDLERDYEKVVSNLDDLALLQYTGGTTGVSKGVMLSHRNLIANMQQTSAGFVSDMALIEGGETVVVPLPLYHIYAFTLTFMVFISSGQCSVLIPNPRDIEGFVDQLGKIKFSVFIGINTLFSGLARHPGFKKLDFSQLKMALSGGMALTQEVANIWRDVTNTEIGEGYGLSETSPVVSLNGRLGEKIGSIGVPVPDTAIRIVDENGEDLSINMVGELYVKGPQVMTGYWNRPDETEKVLSVDGWLKTGDMAYMDVDGYLYIADRKKDVVIVSGFNVYPNEIEQIVEAIDEVVECAAVGVPDTKSGEAVLLVVVSDKKLTKQTVLNHCRNELTPYKVPKHIVFSNGLPKSNVGKILKKDLRKKYKDLF